MPSISRYLSKPFSWWLCTPLYAFRYLRYKLGALSPWKAQYGEDRILAKIFPGKSGFCIEVGCINGIDLSNTYYFEKTRNWDCLLVEADPALIPLCKHNRPKSRVVHAAIVAPGTPDTITFEVAEGVPGMSSISFDAAQLRHAQKFAQFSIRTIEVPAKTLDEVLNEVRPPHIDFITIDIEGYEWGALAGFDIERWRPSVVILERRDEVPDSRIVDYMARHGYVRFMVTPIDAQSDCNDWYKPDVPV